jgi:phosphomannomutase
MARPGRILRHIEALGVTAEPIISVSGLRGIVGDTLTPMVAGRYAAAFAALLPAGPIVVTRDGRANAGELLKAVVAALANNGPRAVFDAGIAATPTTGVLVRQLACSGGVQISASHNPAEWNGLKLFSSEGRVVPAKFGQQVLDRFRMQDAQRGVRSADLSTAIDQTPAASARQLDDTISAHLISIERTVDVARICEEGFRVLLDSNHGAGSVLGAPLLKRLGCRVTLVGGKPDGRFAHPPEPTAENLAGVLDRVAEADADVGFCQDPDADRLAIIDERGRYLGEEHTLALCVDHVLRQTPGPVVTNCSTSRMTEDLASQYGVPFFRSAVGEANVVDEMLARGAVIGGEGNGGVIDPRVGLVRDSFVGMALVLDAMAAREMPVSELADELPPYAIHKMKLELAAEQVPAALDAVGRRFADARPDCLDGLRLDWPASGGKKGRWLLVRASNTEPIVRVIAEAPTANEARSMCYQAAAVIRAVRQPGDG